ncbi:transcriptional regulator [Rhodococcus sp. BP-349]|uniref:transcriptional regulator n=1 Tax=unclassified Rhodococcus (in: high G+C Gram-positive bacteria) TaxID=192944 RepID=UPI001C9AF9EE|nr:MULTISPECIES: transcriptional regulator [unclassified Rhodococcus (in: high G+C Gram-positive bacteria)]MBY6540271.1 transcriptional regulator [Rhodococcus sp. BP-363]MBY6545704.1 transcriptional regulator [Rhodococcus sp. BP-369]MBY6564934.1 transcriptional regulator [Rhodococcus sp. BP-370]MBY6578130.1 transcriptional regulator [Rhodococcus sp. BP-364]MBY6587431.1 transcriptional regulator [Rhodococcus sp. BP-358]
MDQSRDTTSRTRRPALIVLVVVAACGCLALGYWQWERFESSSGTGQNLGYAFQWPLFAAFVVFAYRRFVQLEDTVDEPVESTVITEIPTDLLPQRPPARATRVSDDTADDEETRQLREYNSYLAELDAGRENDRSTS